MRKWLVEETGEFRHAKQGESFLYDENNFFFCAGTITGNQYPICRVTLLTPGSYVYTPGDDTPKMGFDEWW